VEQHSITEQHGVAEAQLLQRWLSRLREALPSVWSAEEIPAEREIDAAATIVAPSGEQRSVLADEFADRVDERVA
jgi:hypothetical protein